MFRDWRESLPSSRSTTSPGPLAVVTATVVTLTISAPLPPPLPGWLTLGALAAVPLAPFCLRLLRQTPQYRPLVALISSAIVVGLLLPFVSVTYDNGRSFDAAVAVIEVGQIIGIVLSLLSALWSLRVLGLTRFLVLWSAGLLVSAPLLFSRFAENPWKFGWALPVTLLLLIATSRSRAGVTLALALLMIISASFDHRSWALILLAATSAAFLTRRDADRGKYRPSTIVGALAVFFVSGQLLLQAILSGRLGEAAAMRTATQLSYDSNPLLAGRPEWGAALQLFQNNPLGYGLGVRPNLDDWLMAVRSMPVAEALQDNSGVATYFRAGIIEFHSNFWNFWSHYGFAGIALIACMGWIFFSAIAREASGARRGVPPIWLTVLMTAMLWDLLFSPTVPSTLGVALAIGISRSTRGSEAGSDDDVSASTPQQGHRRLRGVEVAPARR